MAFTNAMVWVSSDSLEAWASAVWWAIGGFVLITLCLVIGLVWGVIIWTFAKEPKEQQNEWRSIGILFILIIWMIIYWLQQTSDIEKIIENPQNNSWNIQEEIIPE